MVLSPAEYCADPDANPVVGLPLPLSVFLSTLMLNREESTSGTVGFFLTDLITWTDQNPAPEPKHPAPELLRQFMSSLRNPAPDSGAAAFFVPTPARLADLVRLVVI